VGPAVPPPFHFGRRRFARRATWPKVSAQAALRPEPSHAFPPLPIPSAGHATVPLATNFVWTLLSAVLFAVGARGMAFAQSKCDSTRRSRRPRASRVCGHALRRDPVFDDVGPASPQSRMAEMRWRHAALKGAVSDVRTCHPLCRPRYPEMVGHSTVPIASDIFFVWTRDPY